MKLQNSYIVLSTKSLSWTIFTLLILFLFLISPFKVYPETGKFNVSLKNGLTLNVNECWQKDGKVFVKMFGETYHYDKNEVEQIVNLQKNNNGNRIETSKPSEYTIITDNNMTYQTTDYWKKDNEICFFYENMKICVDEKKISKIADSQDIVNYQEAKQIVKNLKCSRGGTVDEYLNEKARLPAVEDLGWSAYSAKNGHDIERLMLLDNKVQLKYRWFISYEGQLKAINGKAIAITE